jgi:hypothetical protein
MTSLFSKVKEGVMTAKKALATDDEAEHGYASRVHAAGKDSNRLLPAKLMANISVGSFFGLRGDRTRVKGFSAYCDWISSE